MITLWWILFEVSLTQPFLICALTLSSTDAFHVGPGGHGRLLRLLLSWLFFNSLVSRMGLGRRRQGLLLHLATN